MAEEKTKPAPPVRAPAAPKTASQIKAEYEDLLRQCGKAAADGIKLETVLIEEVKGKVRAAAGDLEALVARKGDVHTAWLRAAALEKAALPAKA